MKEKLDELPLDRQEKIQGRTKELIQDLMILSESGLSEFWLDPVEEVAWKNLLDKNPNASD